MTKIIYSSTFDYLVDLCIDHFAPYSSEKKVIESIIEVIGSFEELLKDNPGSCPKSPHLCSLGITQYREFNKSGFRILYRYEAESQAIFAAVFCSQKQDLSQLLINYCLLYK